jgi:uncharacterized membrane protein
VIGRSFSKPLEVVHLAVVVGACAAFAAMVGDMPARVPVHWGLDGRPDRWGSPHEYWIFGGVLIFDLAVTWTSLAALARSRGTRPEGVGARWDHLDRRRRRLATRGLQWLMFSLDLVIAVAWPLLGHAAATGADRRVNVIAAGLVIAVVAVIVGFAVVMVRAMRRVERGFEAIGLPSTSKRPEDWRWGGLVYYAPDDPDVWVEKRYGFGWTLNFARPAAWALLAVLLLPGVVITALVLLT